MEMSKKKKVKWDYDGNPELAAKKSIFDSHCHLDRILEVGQPGQKLGLLKAKHEEEFGSKFEGCITVVCDPRDWKHILSHTYLEDLEVHYIVGCHPRFATLFTDKAKRDLRNMFKFSHNKPVALGEIGLDYHFEQDQFAKRRSSLITFKDQQKSVFIEQLELAVELKLPLCLHVREANDDAIDIMKGKVPRDWRIHLHCFSDDYETCERWMREFTHIKFGFVPDYFRHGVVRKLPFEKILLETDAPYFRPKKTQEPEKEKFQKSHPGFVFHTAAQIAKVKRCDVNKVLTICRNNVRQIYGV